MITRLEDLPNEIFFDLFHSIDGRDLFNGFWGLNQRFNELIESLSYLSFTLDEQSSSLIPFLAHRVTRLIVNTWQDIDIRVFSNLHALVLHQVTVNQLRYIRFDSFPHLVFLSTALVNELTLLPYFAQNLFSNTIPSVRHLQLGHLFPPYSSPWFQSPSLRSVSVRCSDPTLIAFILASSPNLITLDVEFTIDTVPIFHQSPSIRNHPLKRCALRDPYHKLIANHIFTLFTWMPNVKRIYLNFQCKIPFQRFAQTVVYRLRNLRRFECNIDDKSSDRTTALETIQNVHPCFARLQCSTVDFQFRTFSTEILV